MKNAINPKLAPFISAMLTAVICIVSQVSVMTPFGVPFTLQIPAVVLCGYLLGAKWGIASVTVYILMGTVGLPVFSGFKGGISVLVGPTGGYLWGFILLSLFCGIARNCENRAAKLILTVLGILLCYAVGLGQLFVLTDVAVNTLFIAVQIIFAVKDLLFGIAMLFTAKTVNKIFVKVCEK